MAEVEKKIQTYVIFGQTPAQKNNKQLYKNAKTGKMFITSSNTVKEWQINAELQLLNKPKVSGRVMVGYVFYVKDNRRRDLDNMIATVNDALVKAGIIEDDCWQILTIAGANASIDKEHPRVVVSLFKRRDERSS